MSTSTMLKLEAVIFAVCLWFGMAAGYNIDTAHPLIIVPPTKTNSSFGFSLAFFTQYSDYQRQNLQRGILVGAPTGANPREAYRAGSLWFCSFPADNSGGSSCTSIVVDRDQSEASDGGRTTGIPYIPLRDNSLLGFSVAAERPDLPGKAIVCAPRWISVKRQSPTPQETVYLPNGLCYMLVPGSRRLAWSKLMPFSHAAVQGISNNVSLLAQAESGFAVQFAKEGRDAFALITAPGYWNGIGTIAHFNLSATEKSATIDRQVRPKILFSNIVDQYCQDEESCYLGFSVSSGNIMGDGETYYASGMPRANSQGMVVVYKRPGTVNTTRKLMFLDEDLDPVFFLTGTQFQESFGYSVLILDINNDGRDDIIVGAPNADDLHDGEGHSGDGLVYVFLSSASWSNHTSHWTKNSEQGGFLRPSYYIAGRESPRAKFGTSLAPLGDTDGDGFNDFAIGSPFGASGGTVYVVYGGSDPANSVVSPLDDPASGQARPRSSGFGFSVAGNIDIDRSTVLDLAVGDFGSESVYLFRGRPTLMWTMNIALQASSHQTLLVTQDRQALVLTSCMYITLHTHGPAISSPQRIKITVTLDPLTDTQGVASSNESRRAVFRESQKPTFVYFRSITPSPGSAPEHSCEVLDADVNSQWNRRIEVVRTPLRVWMSAEIQNDGPAPSSEFCATCYVLSPSAPTTQTLEIPFSQCRPGNGTCEGKIQFAVNNKPALQNSSRIVLGQNTTFLLIYTLKNLGNSIPLYLPQLQIITPQGITVEKIELLLEVFSPGFDDIPGQTTQNTHRLDFSRAQEITTVTPRRDLHRRYQAWIPLGTASAFYPDTTVSFQITFDASEIMSASEAPSRDGSFIEASLKHTPLNDLGDVQIIEREATLVKFAKAFFVDFAASHILEDLRPAVKNNKIMDVSSLHFNLTYKVGNLGPSVIPSGSSVHVLVATASEVGTHIAVDAVEQRSRGTFTRCSLVRDEGRMEVNMKYGSADSTMNHTNTAYGTTEQHILNCQNAHAECLQFDCQLPSLPPKSHIEVLIRARLLEEKLKYETGQQGLLVLTVRSNAALLLPLEIHQEELWKEIKVDGRAPRYGDEVSQTIRIFFHNDKLPNWIIIGTVCGSLCLLLLLTTMLALFGFFRRKRLAKKAEDGEQDTIIEISEDSDEQGGFALDREFHVQMTDNPVYGATPSTPANTYEEIPSRLLDSPFARSAL
ncbi:hypothetical protein RvY_09937 [Ramazzottius varieornatus]|uniref:Integrin alpha third immunoglobulin-like domain-containing protein n=1 Tax=Ramazzottius varieornatus TaxID=947166 RepID=A0A1D1VK26_RAMVA|nr:hypothetical protein RvY_09937 [Ramazzottius varieornatus]